jgi:tetratricopeptide (TPR) repeat protein
MGDAQASVDKAAQVDPENVAVARTDAGLALSKGDLQRASKILKQLPNLDDVISYLNNRGIMLARDQKIAEAVDYYGRVLASLPEGRPQLADSVLYNLALAHARGGDLEKALAAASKAKPKDRLLAAKIGSLTKRLDTALKTNAAFELKGDAAAAKEAEVAAPAGNDVTLPQGGDGTESAAPTIDAAMYEAITALSIGPGDVGCYGIFVVADAAVAKNLAELNKTLPSYKPRDAIRREVSGGVEMLMKRG